MSNADDALLSDIADILRDVFDEEDLAITPEFSRKDNELWDSMNHLNIVFAIESKFKIKLGVVDIEEIQSVADILRIVKQKTGKS
jgi:acyl carrier protein